MQCSLKGDNREDGARIEPLESYTGETRQVSTNITEPRRLERGSSLRHWLPLIFGGFKEINASIRVVL